MQLNQMKMKNNMWNKFLLLSALTAMAGSAAGATATINATVEKGQFKNTMPIAANAAGIPDNLKNTFVVELGFGASYKKTTVGPERSDDKHFLIKAPAKRTVNLTMGNSSKIYQANVSVTYVGGDIQHSTDTELDIRSLGGCSNVGPLANGTVGNQFMWKIIQPDRPQPCVARFANYAPINSEKTIKNLIMAFEIDAPDFLRNAPSGTYKGSLQYRRTAYGDYNFARSAIGVGNWDTIDLNFEFRVVADIQVNLQETVVKLEPTGGWDRYTDTLPNSLQQDIHFTVKSHDMVSLTMLCENPDHNGNCLISNRDTPKSTVRLNIGSAAANNTSGASLTNIKHKSKINLSPSFEKSGLLQFGVYKQGIEEMAKHRGIPYSGNVTLIFEADAN